MAVCNGVAMGSWLLIIGDGRNVLPLVHVEDVVDALLLAAKDARCAPGTVFHVVDDEEITQREVVTLQAGLRVMFVPSP